MDKSTLVIKPRSIKVSERPMEIRSKQIEEAKKSLLKEYSQILRKINDLYSVVEKHNKQIENTFAKKLVELEKKARLSGKPLTCKEIAQLETQRILKYRDAYVEIYYPALQDRIQLQPSCNPDIDTISPFEIRPGRSINLNGTCFGQSQGKVLVEIASGKVVELEVYLWTETQVKAYLNSIIAEVPLRPYYGKIWLQTGNGETSNFWPIMYYPIYSWYIAWGPKEHIFGGLFGNHKDDVFLEDKILGDNDFNLEVVERHHHGSGWSKLTYPHASGQNMGQGYHMGVNAGKHANMSLLYRAYGPKGIYPPSFSDLGPWGWLGDNWY